MKRAPIEPVREGRYSALIRTFNVAEVLPATLGLLGRQTRPPTEYVFVDSGSTDGTLDRVPAGSIVHRFVGRTFSYSGSLNQGLERVTQDYVLIISSHTSLCNRKAVEFALGLLTADHQLAAAYFSDDNEGDLRWERIGTHNFTGFNGLWNTCCVARTPLLRQRPFRLDVFAAEDQEWSRWLFENTSMSIARISGAGMDTDTRNKYRQQAPLRKRLNDYVAVAYFAKPELMGWQNLFTLAYEVIEPRQGTPLWKRLYKAKLILRLLRCHWSKPTYESRYF